MIAFKPKSDISFFASLCRNLYVSFFWSSSLQELGVSFPLRIRDFMLNKKKAKNAFGIHS